MSLAKKPKGYFVSKIYENPNGFCIYSYRGKSGSFRVKGNNLPTDRINWYEFYGEWEEHPSYGATFKAFSYDAFIEHKESAIKEYLVKNFKGIGPSLADKILAKFGVDALDELDKNPMCLEEFKGVSHKKAEKIASQLVEKRLARSIVLEFTKRLIPQSLAISAYKRFGSSTMQIIQEEPYRLCEVDGITFHLADRFVPNDETMEFRYDRFLAASNWILEVNESGHWSSKYKDEQGGSTCMIFKNFMLCAYDELYRRSLTTNDVHVLIQQACNQGDLVCIPLDGDWYIFRSGIYKIEMAIAGSIHRLSSMDSPYTRDEILDVISRLDNPERPLDAEQREAVVKAFTHTLSMIIGYPGAGKTTTIQMIEAVYRELMGNSIYFIAPSGKAAKRMTEATGHTALTAHSQFCLSISNINAPKKPNPEKMIYHSLVVIDEMSMLDIRTAQQVFSHIREGCFVVLSGDDEQLPSVGAGAVLRDLIQSQVFPVTELTTVYRTDIATGIYQSSMAMRKGETNLIFDDTFHFVEVDTAEEMQGKMLELYEHKFEQLVDDGEDGISISNKLMMLAPFKQRPGGVIPLNKQVQEDMAKDLVDDESLTWNDVTYHIGDLVMQTKNILVENDQGKPVRIANGEIGQVIDVHDEDGDPAILVQYEFEESCRDENGQIITSHNSLTHAYNQNEAKHLDLSYAYTVHKSQGSQADCVITCIHPMHHVMLKRNIIYTAVTRAKYEVWIVGTKQALKQAILTEDKTKRHTALCTLIKNIK